MKETQLEILYKEATKLGEDKQRKANSEKEADILLFKRVDKLRNICDEELIKKPIKKLFRKSKCPECGFTLRIVDIWWHGVGAMGYLLSHFVCGNCDYEYSERKEMPVGFS